MNKINYDFFKNKTKINEDKSKNIIFANSIQNKIGLIKNDLSYYFEFTGLKIIRCLNTNKAIRELIFQNHIESYIKINDIFVKQKDIIIISPFTRINDILSSRNNSNVHSYLKEKNILKTNNQIEEFVINKLSDLDDNIKNLIEYDLSKCDLINYIDIKDEFISDKNIQNVLEIIKTYDKKQTIIINDVDYLSYELIIKFSPYFNFLYFVNSLDEEYKMLTNYKEFLIEYDQL